MAGPLNKILGPLCRLGNTVLVKLVVAETGNMLKLGAALSFMAVLLGAGIATGVWVRGDGSQEVIECATGFEEGGRARLGLGCTAFAPGVLLSRDKYKELILELEARWQDKVAMQEQNKLLADRVKALENTLKITMVKEPEPCNCINPFAAGSIGLASGLTACLIIK